jgi:hypothetical protein
MIDALLHCWATLQHYFIFIGYITNVAEKLITLREDRPFFLQGSGRGPYKVTIPVFVWGG